MGEGDRLGAAHRRRGGDRGLRQALQGLSLGGLLVLGGCAARPPSVPDANVFVVGQGWHTQIYLPAADLQGGMRKFAVPATRYVGFGFGQRAFLLRRSHSVLGYLRGFFRGLAPAPGAMIVTWLQTSPQTAWGAAHTVGLHAAPAQMTWLNRVLWGDFVHRNGAPMTIGPGDYPGSAFYAATQRYDLAFTCNTWTDATLHAAGLGMPKNGTVFATQTMADARALAAGR